MLRLSSQTQQSKVRAQLELLLRKAEPGERLPPAELHPHCLTSSFFNLPFLSGILKIEQCLSLLSYSSLSLTFRVQTFLFVTP